jgi:hypothetical protein
MELALHNSVHDGVSTAIGWQGKTTKIRNLGTSVRRFAE